ncbi:hypothetical protein [Embleya scabrispora]|uniref:hypothetical protein n=1 Tax=Embleya scabrispora TaxID=159449 RepID=UPI00039A3B35
MTTSMENGTSDRAGDTDRPFDSGPFDALRADATANLTGLRELYEQPGAAAAANEVYPHCPKALLRSSARKPEGWLPADAQPSSAEVTPARLRMPGLTIADVRQAEEDSLKYRYE